MKIYPNQLNKKSIKQLVESSSNQLNKCQFTTQSIEHLTEQIVQFKSYEQFTD